MPRKVFVAGEILTAADVNTNLMDQAVMVFDDSTARGSAIPSPSEGMVTYLKDTDTLEKYTTAWVPASGLVESKTAVKTDTQSSSVAAGASAAISGLVISHTVQNATNKVLLIAQVSGGAGGGSLNAALTAGGSLLNLGDSSGSRHRSSANNRSAADGGESSVSLVALYSPGVTTSIDYGVSVINGWSNTTQTIYVNRSVTDSDAAGYTRSASVLTLLEVAV